MDFGQAMRQLGRPVSWGEAIAALKPLGSSAQLSEMLGVPARTVRAWMSGERQASPRTAQGRDRISRVMAAGAEQWRHVAAGALRRARTVSVGRVGVLSKSSDKDAGTREVGSLRVDQDLQAELGEVADLLEAGDDLAAGAALSESLLGEASANLRGSGGNREGYRAHLYVYDYPDGVSVG